MNTGMRHECDFLLQYRCIRKNMYYKSQGMAVKCSIQKLGCVTNSVVERQTVHSVASSMEPCPFHCPAILID